MQRAIEFKKVREFGEIIGDTFLFIKQNFKPLMKAYFYLCGLFMLGGFITALFANLQFVGMLDPAKVREMNNPFRMILNFGINYFLIMLFYALSYTSFFCCILSYIALYIRKGNVPPSVQEVWSYFKYYFFRVLGGGFLNTLLFMVAFIACVIPGIWVFPALTLFYPVMIMENASIGTSFDRGFKLIKEEWWITFATLVVIYIIVQACTLLVQVPALAITWASAFTHLDRPLTATYAIVTSISGQLSMIFMIIPIVSFALIYFNLVERKESTGLMDRIDAFGGAKTTDFTPEEY